MQRKKQFIQSFQAAARANNKAENRVSSDTGRRPAAAKQMHRRRELKTPKKGCLKPVAMQNRRYCMASLG